MLGGNNVNEFIFEVEARNLPIFMCLSVTIYFYEYDCWLVATNSYLYVIFEWLIQKIVNAEFILYVIGVY